MNQTSTPIITGELIPKRVAAYMKQAHKSYCIRVERAEDGSFFVADGFCIVKVQQSNDLFPYTFFKDGWQRATFSEKEMSPSEGGADCAALWRSWGLSTVEPLTLTHYLYEIAGERNKPGKLYRQLTRPEYGFVTDRERVIQNVLLDKRICDLFAIDVEELDGFLFESTGVGKPVRVSARNGIVGYVMPLVKSF